MATTTANAYVNAEVRASGALMFPTDYIQVAKKTSRYALMQFSIPNLTDVSISSAKLRFYILKTAKEDNLYAILYDFASKVLNTSTVYSDISEYLNAPVLDSSGKYTITNVTSGYNSWAEIDITNLISGNLGKSNFTIGVAAESATSSYTHNIGNIAAGYTPQIIITYTYATPFAPTLNYPVGDIVKNSGTVRFSWKYNAGQSSTGQSKYEFGWKLQSETEWNTTTVSSSNKYHDIDASIFANGIVEWRVRTYNARGLSSEYSTAQFFVVGKPPNPGINYVKNNAITEIQWSANKSEEVAAQLRLTKGGEVIYDSGKIAGGIDDTHVPNMLLSDGQYAALLRISNLYDMWSDWTSQTFTIGGTKPGKPVIRVCGQGDYVHLEIDGTASEFFVYRSDGGEFVPIGRTPLKEYDDYAVESGKLYQYFVRAYTQSYTDSDKKDIFVRYKGRIVSSVNDMAVRIGIKVNVDEDVGVSGGVSRSDVLMNYVGRQYPVKEKAEFKSEELSINAFLYEKDAKQLIDIINSGDVVCIRGDGLKLYGSIGAISMQWNVLFGGYTVSFTVERVDYEEGVRFDV